MLPAELPVPVDESSANQPLSPTTDDLIVGDDQASTTPPKVDSGAADYKLPQDKKSLVSIYLGDNSFRVTIADSRAEWIKGLSGSPKLPFGEGKLFIFTETDRHGIWMKDMLFALDIIWFNEAGKIIHMAPNIAPESFPEVFRPPEAARFVLEISAGTVDIAGLVPGDELIIDKQYLPVDLH